MKLSPEYRDMLIKEISYCREKMVGEQNPLKQAFYYSALYWRINSILSLEFNYQLYFMNYVIATSYNTIANYFAEDHVYELPSSFFETLCRYLGQLETKIRNGEDVYSVLEKIANLTMIADGTGNYLFEKGVLKIRD